MLARACLCVFSLRQRPVAHARLLRIARKSRGQQLETRGYTKQAGGSSRPVSSDQDALACNPGARKGETKGGPAHQNEEEDERGRTWMAGKKIKRNDKKKTLTLKDNGFPKKDSCAGACSLSCVKGGSRPRTRCSCAQRDYISHARTRLRAYANSSAVFCTHECPFAPAALFLSLPGIRVLGCVGGTARGRDVGRKGDDVEDVCGRTLVYEAARIVRRGQSLSLL